MVVSITASTTTGKPLPEEVLSKTIEACDRALAFGSAKMPTKLMGTAGSLSALAKIPACNVQLLGAKKMSLNSPLQPCNLQQSIIQLQKP